MTETLLQQLPQQIYSLQLMVLRGDFLSYPKNLISISLFTLGSKSLTCYDVRLLEIRQVQNKESKSSNLWIFHVSIKDQKMRQSTSKGFKEAWVWYLIPS